MIGFICVCLSVLEHIFMYVCNEPCKVMISINRCWVVGRCSVGCVVHTQCTQSAHNRKEWKKMELVSTVINLLTLTQVVII